MAPCSVNRLSVHWSWAYSDVCIAWAFTLYGLAYIVMELGAPATKVYWRCCEFVFSSRLSIQWLPWYPTLMLCEPVTYDADVFHVVPLVLLTHQCCERNVVVCVNGVWPGGEISWLRFTTRTRSRVGFGSSSFPAHW